MTFPSIAALEQPRSRNRFAYLTLWSTYAVFALLVISLEFITIIREGGAQKPLGWTYARVENEWRVGLVSPTGPAAKLLQPGDRIVAIDGNPNANIIGPKWFLRDSPDRTNYTLTVIRNGSHLTQTIQWPTVYSTFERRWQWVSLACVLINLAVGILIVFGKPDSMVAQRAALSTMASLGFWFTFIVETPTGIVSHIPLFLGLTYFFIRPYHLVAGYWFTKAFPYGDHNSKGWRRFDRIFFPACLLIWIPSAYVGVIRSLGPERATEIATAQYPLSLFHDGLVSSVYFLFAAVAAFANSFVAWHNYKQVPPGDLQRRMRWVIIGVVIGMLPVVLVAPFLFIKNFAGIRPSMLVHVVNTTATLVPICVAYAILKYRVLGIRVVIRTGLQYLLARNVLRIAIALPVVLIALEIVRNPGRPIGEFLSGRSGAVNLAMLVLIALALRYRKTLMSRIDQRFFRDAYRQDQIFVELAEAIGGVKDIPELARLLSSQLQSALHPTRVLALTRGNSREFDVVYSSESTKTVSSLSDFGISVDDIRDVSGVVAVSDIPGMSADGKKSLQMLDFTLAVPISGPNEGLVGLILLGDKKSEEPYTRNDRRLLATTAAQTGIVWENLQLRQALSREQGVRRNLASRLDGTSAIVMECPECGTCYDGDVERCPIDGRALTPSLPTARVIDGKYQLNRVIGRGGMGAVYAATDLRLDRIVAVKAVMGTLFDDATARHRFAREARASARVVHPNVVGVYDVGEFDGGAYLVLEYLHGHSLRAELAKKGRITREMVEPLIEQIFAAVSAAHAQKVIHRDLKPENIFLTNGNDGNPASAKILDFGLAIAHDIEYVDQARLTRTGTAVGTVAYMSPEQLVGDSVDVQSDIHALGIIVLEILTGSIDLKGPFFARAEPILQERLANESHSAEERAVAEVLRGAFHPAKEDRYSSVSEFRQELMEPLRKLVSG